MLAVKYRQGARVGGRFVTSDFRREVAEDFALQGCYTASRGNFLPTFRDSLSVPSSGFENFFGFSNPESGTDRLSRNVGKKLPPLAV